MVIPLFKLPFLALIDVIQKMDLLELVSMSLTSARARRVIRCHSKTQIIVIQVSCVSGTGEAVLFGFNQSKMNRFPGKWDSETDTTARFKNSITFLVNTFKVDSIHFQFIRSDSEGCCQLVEHARSHGLRFKEVFCVGSLESAEQARRFMIACRGADTLTIDAYNFPADNLIVVGDDNMSTLINCSNVRISCSSFESRELNRFLKSWMQGTGRIQKLKMIGRRTNGIGRIDDAVVMDGIDRVEMWHHSEWQIQRQDGTRATINLFPNFFDFEILAD